MAEIDVLKAQFYDLLVQREKLMAAAQKLATQMNELSSQIEAKRSTEGA